MACETVPDYETVLLHNFSGLGMKYTVYGSAYPSLFLAAMRILS